MQAEEDSSNHTAHEVPQDPRTATILDLILALASGELEARAEPSGVGDELDAIMTGLNMLAEELASRHRALQRANKSLQGKMKELRDTQEELVQAGKMAAVGTLAAGLSHEINNPLGIILGYAQSLLSRGELNEPTRKALTSIERQASRCAKLVRTMLDFSRRTMSLERSAVNPLAIIERVLEFTGPRAKRHGVELRVLRPDESLPDLLVSPTEIESALLNFVNNAIDATPVGGNIGLWASRLRLAGTEGVEFAVCDTGAGMSPETISRIFDPFYTTKPPGQGTGLGMSLARQVVERHRGRIQLESTPGAGTTVRTWLPLNGEDAPQPSAAPSSL